ncbi:hypothetical protein FRB97_004769 [Tulasnella sp. 331]|nr:hypothetical protein FRB97_004769 [Tulasnella sp. 331]
MDMRNMDGGLEDLLEPPAPRERRRRRGWSGGGRSGQLASASSRSLPAPSGPREYINIEDSPPPLSPSRLSPLFGVEDNTDVKPGPSTSSQNPLPTTTTLPPPPSAQSGPAPARDYTCPICFSAPTAAVLTPCGHVTCGACLFSSVEVAQKRSRSMGYGGDALLARCPVCRAVIQDWDGKGAGVIGLEFKVGPVMRS